MFNNIGFIGSGPIAQALAHHLVTAQIPVRFSNSRGPSSLTELVAELGDPAEAVTVEQAATADVVILALPFLRVPELAEVVPDWTGRIVVDATNQFAEYSPTYRGYVDLGEETGSEWVARHLPGATIIKAFNAMYAEYITRRPSPPRWPPGGVLRRRRQCGQRRFRAFGGARVRAGASRRPP